MRLSILDDYQGVALDMADWAPVRARGIEIAVERFPFADEDDVVRSLADSEIVAAMRERTAFPKSVVDRLPKLTLLITTGMRNASFDMAALKDRGVTVCGTGGPGGGNEDTAELAWGLILGAARRIAEDHQFMRQGGWQTRIGHRVAGKTLGLLGLGRLGSAVARVGLAFGMKAIAWSQNLTAERASEQGVERVELRYGRDHRRVERGPPRLCRVRRLRQGTFADRPSAAHGAECDPDPAYRLRHRGKLSKFVPPDRREC